MWCGCDFPCCLIGCKTHLFCSIECQVRYSFVSEIWCFKHVGGMLIVAVLSSGTLDPVYQELSLARSPIGTWRTLQTEDYRIWGSKVHKLEVHGRSVEPALHDYHNHHKDPNHSIQFGNSSGASLQMLRDPARHSYQLHCQWLSFDAWRFVHRVKLGDIR